MDAFDDFLHRTAPAQGADDGPQPDYEEKVELLNAERKQVEAKVDKALAGMRAFMGRFGITRNAPPASPRPATASLIMKAGGVFMVAGLEREFLKIVGNGDEETGADMLTAAMKGCLFEELEPEDRDCLEHVVEIADDVQEYLEQLKGPVTHVRPPQEPWATADWLTRLGRLQPEMTAWLADGFDHWRDEKVVPWDILQGSPENRRAVESLRDTVANDVDVVCRGGAEISFS